MALGGNVFLRGAKHCGREAAPLLRPEFDPGVRLVETPNGFELEIKLDKAWAAQQPRKVVTSELLGKATIPNCRFERADGSQIRIDTDFFGRARKTENPFPGPFEWSSSGKQVIKIWAVATN